MYFISSMATRDGLVAGGTASWLEYCAIDSDEQMSEKKSHFFQKGKRFVFRYRS